jgi:hypothetical protein
LKTPVHVHWDACLSALKLMKQNAMMVIIEHFLLLHDPSVIQELDGMLFLDPGQDGIHLCCWER